MKKIPCNVQSLLSASNQINNHNKAVEELVYNALDAGATSIAVRINIQENTIQVIDNGSGVCSKDFNFIGHKYMTSKFVDLPTLKSVPSKYGFCGQFLSNLTTVSKSVNFISRHEKCEETWIKSFEHGKEKEIKKCTTRPSKGTTVEVKGLLYNLNIQKKSKDILGELKGIKTFLEHLSIVHSHISLSLRDDSKNEIVFKMHKNRDIYQTLSKLYNIVKKDFQELQVEKNEYKVTGFLGKSDNETVKHLIFLNGKFISSPSKLHEIINNNLKKQINLKGIEKHKSKDHNKDDENRLFQKKIPDYFIFIKCPYMDYNLSNSPNQLVLEFKNWNRMIKLLEKLINFVNGDVNLKEVNELQNNKAIYKATSETREQVKKIMEKILGTQSKKPGISHLQNGIKGKDIKRKCKKLTDTTTTKTINLKENNNENDKATNKNIFDDKCIIDKGNPNIKGFKVRKNTNTNKPVANKYSKATDLTKPNNSKFNKILKNNNKLIVNKRQPQKKKLAKENNNIKMSGKYEDKLLRKFQMNTDCVKRRCNELHQKTSKMLQKMNEENYKVFLNENAQFNSITKSDIKVAICKQIDEIVIHDYNAKAPKYNLTNYDNVRNNGNSKVLPSNYDLLQTVLKSQQLQGQIVNEAYNVFPIMDQQPKTTVHEAYRPIREIESEKNLTAPMVTFQSHNYHANYNLNVNNNAYTKCNTDLQIENNDYHNVHKRSRNFITKESRDNFTAPKSYKNNVFKGKNMKTGLAKQFKSNIKRLFNQTSKLFNLKKQIMGNSEDSSLYTIEFTRSNKYKVTADHEFVINPTDWPTNPKINSKELWSQSINFNNNVCNTDHISVNTNISKIDDKGSTVNDYNWNIYGTYTIEHTNDIFNRNQAPNEDIALDENCLDNNFVYISESQGHSQNEQINDPINVCEVVLNSQEILDREFEFSFNSEQNNLSKVKIIDDNNSQKKPNDSLYDNLYINDNEQKQEINEDQYPPHVEKLHAENIFQEMSHHFSLPNNEEIVNTNKVNETKNQGPILTTKFNTRQKTINEKPQTLSEAVGKILKDLNLNNFNLKNRLCFLPKGMSPIFENCHTKNACEYNLAKDYYEEEMYDNFVDNVRNNAEIFKPKVQEAKKLTTKAIDKVNAKLNKDNSSLKFDAESLKNAKVLGQIDEKFIATIMKGGCIKEEITDFLVLFDQHAVHERIRLEKNLSDYFSENQWKPVNIDEVRLKISKEDILYLHNQKDKFEQLGLRWTVLDTNEVSFIAIAEAILGNNPRQMDIVLKAIKSLITEEINIIKMQGGCVSLYPKSIMDLVCSEACRYAIKFGDKLSKSECADLLKMLSDCKMPFQCAHGRPVMAVIMDNKLNKVEYKVNLNKVLEWKEMLRYVV